MTDVSIRQFVAEQRELLELELEADQDRGSVGGDDKSDDKASHVLGPLEASDVSVGLYGRTVVHWTHYQKSNESGDQKIPTESSSHLLLPAHRFTVGDEIELRAKPSSSGQRPYSPGGVIISVTDYYVEVALFPSRNSKAKANSKRKKGEDDDDGLAGLGAPPFTMVPKSSIQVHRKMMRALDQLEQHGGDHPVAGRVIRAMFTNDKTLSTTTRQAPLSSSSSKHQSDTPSFFNTRLDQSQQDAIRFALETDRPIALIHGPPGTGKTTTIAELIQQAVGQHKMKVLVTAPSNVAVDNVLERLIANNHNRSANTKRKTKQPKVSSLRAVRLGHPARLKPAILPYSLEALVQSADGTEIVADVRAELKGHLKTLANPRSKGLQKRKAYLELKVLRKEIRSREEKVVQELLSNAQVVLATTVGAANKLLEKAIYNSGHEGGFDLVVIDEAAQALEASCWIPVLRGRKVVLAGDHCQLPPTIKTQNKRAQVGLSKTMFERLMELYRSGAEDSSLRISRMLQVQYRMHQHIANWASKTMYQGQLRTHSTVKSRTLGQLESVRGCLEQHKTGVANNVLEPEELARNTLLLVDTAGCDMHETVNPAGSRFNEGEANIVSLHVRQLMDMGLTPPQLAIITPYNGQVEYLRAMLLPDFPKLEIRSVDGFQGGEREAVILSLVRSSDLGGSNGIGFLKENRRQNVAVTRAKRHLMVVCDSETVSQSPFIQSLITWIEDHGEQRSAMEYLVEGMVAANTRYDEQDLLMAEAIMFGAVPMKTKKAPVASNPNPTTTTKASNGPTKGRDQLDQDKRKELMGQIANFSETGSPGEEWTLSADLSSLDRKLVHELAEQLGLGHRSEGEGATRRISLSITAQKTQATAALEQTAAEADTQTQDGDADQTLEEVQLFAVMQLDAEESEDEGGDAKDGLHAEDGSSSNSLLAQLSKEPQERQKQQQKSAAVSSRTASNKKKKKPKGRKLGGGRKPQPKEEEDNLDDLDDMLFLDAQIEKAQNLHGRKVAGSGKGYRTIVNGILNAVPEPRVKPTNTRAAASLQSKLKDAQNSRKAKNTKKKSR